MLYRHGLSLALDKAPILAYIDIGYCIHPGVVGEEPLVKKKRT